MPNLSQGNRRARAVLDIIKPIRGLSAILAGGVALAWGLLTKDNGREKAPRLQTLDKPVGEMFLTATVADIGLELTAPDGGKVSVFVPGSATKSSIADAQPKIDCADAAGVVAGDSTCTISVQLKKPAFGDWKVRLTAASPHVEVLSIAWGGIGFNRNGGLALKIAAEAKKPLEFTMIVAPEGVSQRTEPRPVAR
jgi:hypothetical protein